MTSKTIAAHNAARILSNLSSSHLSKLDREECRTAAHAIYQAFGEPDQPMTSAGGNYFDIAAPEAPRQDIQQMASMPVERCYDVRAKMIIAFNESRKNGGDLDDGLDAAYKAALRYSPAPLSPDHSGGGAGMVLPEGWKLVPIEPTREMLNRTPMHPDLARSLYSALLADSPSFDKVKELNQ